MQKPRYTQWVKIYTKKYWYLLGVLFLISTLGVLFELAGPLPLKLLADNVFGSHTPPSFLDGQSKLSLLVIASLAYIGIFAAQSLYSLFQSLASLKFNQIVDKTSLNESYSAASLIPYNDTTRLDPGVYLYQITNQSQQVSEYLFNNLVPIFQSLMTLLGIVIILAKINLHIMLVTFAVMPLLAGAIILFGKLIEKRANDTEIAHAKVYSFVNDSMNKLRTIQAFSLGKKRQTQLNEIVDIRNKTAIKQLITNETFGLTTQFIILCAISIAIFLGGRSVFDGLMTFGDLLIFITYTNDVFEHVSNIIGNVGSMKEQGAALQQAYDTIYDSSRHQNTSGELKNPIRGQIEFRSVDISRGSTKVLEDVNLNVAPGSVVAFVGLSGSGKTTLINSLLRFVPPSKGVITIDGSNIHDYDLTYLRQNISLIDQEPELFELSIKDNIAVSDIDRSFNLPDVMSAAAVSNSTEFIDTMPEKYDSVVDDQKVSGGQKQRIAVARAYYKKAPIILMDEPTSALDSNAANVFIDNMFKYFGNRTILIITHDLSLLKRIPTIYAVRDHHVVPIAELGGLENYSRIINPLQP